MGRGKKLLIFLGVMVVLVAAAIIVVSLQPKETEEEDEDTIVYETLYSVDASDITEISWTYNGETVTFDKDGESWAYAADSAFPADETILETMVDTISEVGVSKTISDVTDFDQYGLEEPDVEVTVVENETVTFAFGDETSVTGEVYCSMGDGNVYLVDASLKSAFEYKLFGVALLETIPVMDDITSFTVSTDTEEFTAVYKEDSGYVYTDEYSWFVKDGASYTALDSTLVSDYTANVSGIALTSLAEYNADEAVLAEYGLDVPDTSVVINYTVVTESESETDADGNETDSDTAESTNSCVFGLDMSKTDSGYYARISGSDMIYKITEDEYDAICYSSYDDLIATDVFLMDWDEVDGVDIVLDGTTYKVEKVTRVVEAETEEAESETEEDADASEDSEADEAAEEETEAEPEYETVWVIDGADVDLDSALDDITSLASTGSARGTTSEGDSVISFVIRRDGSKFSEVTISFNSYNGSSCVTVLDGEATVYVARSDIDSLAETFKEALGAE